MAGEIGDTILGSWKSIYKFFFLEIQLENDQMKFVSIFPPYLSFPGIEQVLILFNFTEDGAIFTFGRNIDGQVSILFNFSFLRQWRDQWLVL